MLVAILVLAGCGDGGGTASEPPRPTSVSVADLQRDGTFWRELTPDLKDDLVDAAKERFANSHPDGATKIRAVDRAALVAEIDKQYTNVGNRTLDIDAVYQRANGKIALDSFNETMSQLDDLRGQR
jgi:hypothetical protein